MPPLGNERQILVCHSIAVKDAGGVEKLTHKVLGDRRRDPVKSPYRAAKGRFAGRYGACTFLHGDRLFN